MGSQDPKDLELIRAMAGDRDLARHASEVLIRSSQYRYTYNFSWLGRPIIQNPEDVVALQEIVWKTKPEAIVETGIAHGGSLIFYASLLALLGGDGIVVGVDIDIRPHNRVEIESHPLANRITMLEGSSTADSTVGRVADAIKGKTRVLVILDSNHTDEHVYQELQKYSPFVRKGSYLVVLDTVVEKMPADFYPDRPWGLGNNPMTAVRRFLAENDRFAVDEEYDKKLMTTMAPEGYLKCLADP